MVATKEPFLYTITKVGFARTRSVIARWVGRSSICWEKKSQQTWQIYR